MHIHQEVNERFPVRNTKEQKQEFRDYLLEKAQEMGYSACVEATDKKGNTQNVVVGDAEHAQVIFTAHYDTPRRAIMPNLMMPRSPLASVGYALLLVVPLLFVALGARYLAVTYLHLPESVGMLIYLLLYFGIFYFLMLGGPVNPHNANDNTSGCAALLKYEINAEKCLGCTLCARSCPVGAISGKLKEAHVIDAEKCIRCGQCLGTCKFGAVSVS